MCVISLFEEGKVMYEIEEISKTGYFRCKEFPEIIVTKTGVFKTAKTHELLTVSDAEGRYPTFTYPGSGTVMVHRILALMFVEKPSDFKDKIYVVNHIDGVKTNFVLENLEWVTYSRNSIHAYQTGLRDDNTPIMVKDLRTNVVKRYYSLQECARQFKVNGFNIHWNLLPRNRGKVSYNYFVIIREGDVWPEVDMSLVGTHRNGRPKPVVAVCVETNHATVYDSAGSAARAFGCKPATLRKRMHENPTAVYSGHLFKYLDDADLKEDLEMLSIGRKTTPPTRTPLQISVKDVETGNTVMHESTEEFARIFGVDKATIQLSIGRNSGRWRNYLITYIRPPKK